MMYRRVTVAFLPSVANAFTAVVNSLVSNILLPPFGLLPFMDRNVEEKFVVLRPGELLQYLDSVQN
jgi:large-conductance mechanosensitive channel